VTVYPANPSGTLNEAPTATINVGVVDGGVTLYGVGVDASGKIYVATPGSIFVYAANPVGAVTTPIATIAGSNTELAEIHNFAFDAAGRIYVTDNVHGILIFPPSPTGTLNEAPVANIPRNATTGLFYPGASGSIPAERSTRSTRPSPRQEVGGGWCRGGAFWSERNPEG
jgi:hypothetical protein